MINHILIRFYCVEIDSKIDVDRNKSEAVTNVKHENLSAISRSVALLIRGICWDCSWLFPIVISKMSELICKYSQTFQHFNLVVNFLETGKTTIQSFAYDSLTTICIVEAYFQGFRANPSNLLLNSCRNVSLVLQA